MSTSFSNFKSATKPAILIAGPPGTCKTTISSMIGTPHIVELDNNIDGPFRYIAKSGLPCKAQFSVPHIKPDGTLVPRQDRWKAMTDAINQNRKDHPECDTDVIDSLTSLVAVALDQVRVLQKKKIGDPERGIADDAISQPDWGVFGGLMTQFLLTMRASGRTLVLLAHLKYETDEIDKIIKQCIACPGQTGDTISGLFTDVWLTGWEERGTGASRVQVPVIRTVPSGIRESRLGLKSGLQLPTKFDVDLSKINQLVK